WSAHMFGADRLRNTSIRGKIAIAFVALVVLIAALGGWSLYTFRAFNRNVEEITNNYRVAVGYVDEMRSSVLNSRVALLNGINLRNDPQVRSRTDATLDGYADALRTAEAK